MVRLIFDVISLFRQSNVVVSSVRQGVQENKVQNEADVSALKHAR